SCECADRSPPRSPSECAPDFLSCAGRWHHTPRLVSSLAPLSASSSRGAEATTHEGGQPLHRICVRPSYEPRSITDICKSWGITNLSLSFAGHVSVYASVLGEASLTTRWRQAGRTAAGTWAARSAASAVARCWA